MERRCYLWWGQSKNTVWKLSIQHRGLLCYKLLAGRFGLFIKETWVTRWLCSGASFLFLLSLSLTLCFHELLFLGFLPALPFFRSFYFYPDVQFLRCFLFQLSVSTCAWCSALTKLYYRIWENCEDQNFYVCWTPT